MPDDKSNAMPMHLYRDPALVAETNELHSLGCQACEHSHRLLGKVYCTSPKNETQKGVPRIGHRCKIFKLRG